MAAEPKKLHVVVFPWLAFGHMIPFLELAKSIAQKGHRVTFVSTPRNIDRLPKIPSTLISQLNYLKLPLPQIENLPENAEATTDLPITKVHCLKKAYDGLQIEVAQFLETTLPDWLIYDFASHSLPSMVGKLGISLAFFSSMNAWSATFFGSAKTFHTRTKPEDFLVPPKWVPFPSKVAFRRHELMRMAAGNVENASGVSDWDRVAEALIRCDAILVRSCRELESDWLDLTEKMHEKPVITVGLMPPSARDREDDGDDTWHTISGWLNLHGKESVIYVALGTEVAPSREELTELATGLELSGLPFFWALRKKQGPSEFESLELPDGFEERVKDRGIVWTSWTPQLRVLAHDSVGGFLTHCGWSSVIEGLQNGRPLVMLPFQLDQGLNARALEEKMVGIEVPRDEDDGSLSTDSVAESLRLIMTDQKGQIYRDKAKEMKLIFGDRDLQEKYEDNLIEYLEKIRGLI
ncbi:putative UDP-rhamnose:rhamnosyltransferase 1 [Coffea arabica]|uniref:Glycosyltransferase n=1 Tax=Coffea arabica TaxID=13443 RepID=A0A6P6THV6_COFAR|nr:putative UDP-rhamnose:rhamnosyltransferase 1 [Coffea arabica]